MSVFPVLIMAVCSGCRSVPRGESGFYPIGLWGVRDTNHFEIVKAAGFNALTGPASREWLDSANAAGLKVLVFPGWDPCSTQDWYATRRVVKELDRHPAVWGWYMCDEPDLRLIDPVRVSAACKLWKRAGATKPVAVTVYHGAAAAYYGVDADIVLVDRYPVPWQPLAGFGQHVQLGRLAIGPRKKLIGVVQAFDWSYHTDVISAPGPFRPPTYAELRCMTYSALVYGVNGLFYYTFDDGRWRMRDHLGTWRDLHTVVSEVNMRIALFRAKQRWWPKNHVYPDFSQAYSEALESSVISALLVVERGSGDCPVGEYLVAVNTTGRLIDYMIASPWEGLGYVSVLGEGRVIGIMNGWLRDVFQPYDVHVYGPVAFKG